MASAISSRVRSRRSRRLKIDSTSVDEPPGPAERRRGTANAVQSTRSLRFAGVGCLDDLRASRRLAGGRLLLQLSTCRRSSVLLRGQRRHGGRVAAATRLLLGSSSLIVASLVDLLTDGVVLLAGARCVRLLQIALLRGGQRAGGRHLVVHLGVRQRARQGLGLRGRPALGGDAQDVGAGSRDDDPVPGLAEAETAATPTRPAGLRTTSLSATRMSVAESRRHRCSLSGGGGSSTCARLVYIGGRTWTNAAPAQRAGDGQRAPAAGGAGASSRGPTGGRLPARSSTHPHRRAGWARRPRGTSARYRAPDSRPPHRHRPGWSTAPAPRIRASTNRARDRSLPDERSR